MNGFLRDPIDWALALIVLGSLLVGLGVLMAH